MKKILIGLLAVTTFLVMASCGSKSNEGTVTQEKRTEDTKQSKSNLASITIEGGEYVLPDGEMSEDTDNVPYLALKVTIKNETSDSLELSQDDITLYDKEDSKLDQADVFFDEDAKMKPIAYEKVAGKKSKTGYVVFAVEKTEKYTLHFEPHSWDLEKKVQPITLQVDASKYKDDTKSAVKATTALIDEVFLAKESKDYEKYVANDKEELIKKYDENFISALKKKFYYYKPTAEELLTVAKAFRENNNKVAKVEVTLKQFTPDTAEVLVSNIKGVTFEEMKEAIEEVEEDNEHLSGMSSDESSKKQDQAVLKELPKIIKDTKAESIDTYGDGFRLKLKKKDGKWEINTKESRNQYKEIEQALRGNLYK